MFCTQLMQKVLGAVVLLRKKRVLSAPFQQRFRPRLSETHSGTTSKRSGRQRKAFLGNSRYSASERSFCSTRPKTSGGGTMVKPFVKAATFL